jgi:hypothetical protein
MTARCAALAVTAILGVPAVASAAEVSVDQDCFAQGKTVTITGSGYTPGSTATLVLGTATGTTPVDDQGGFTTTLTAPQTSLKHPGAQQLSLSATDAAGVAATTPVNIARTGVDGVPSTSKPHQRITWNIAGFPGIKALYGHWRIHGRTRANHRMGVPKGPCGVLHVRARQIEAKHVLFGTWLVQFDFNRRYDRHALPRASVEILVSRTFSRARA